MTEEDLQHMRQWYSKYNLANKVVHANYVNGEGVLVYGRVITYPATVEEWIRDEMNIAVPDNYGQPVTK